MKTEYVVGFLYDKDKSFVVLIEKQRPAWQRGRLNGVGGHIEPDETPLAAMRREFKEEAGLDVEDWKLAVEMTSPTWKVYFFVACGPVDDVLSQTDEKLRLVSLHYDWPPRILPQFRWLISLCLDPSIEKPVSIRDVTEQLDIEAAEAAGGEDEC